MYVLAGHSRLYDDASISGGTGDMWAPSIASVAADTHMNMFEGPSWQGDLDMIALGDSVVDKDGPSMTVLTMKADANLNDRVAFLQRVYLGRVG